MTTVRLLALADPVLFVPNFTRTISRAGRKGRDRDARKLRTSAQVRKTIPGMQKTRDIATKKKEEERKEQRSWINQYLTKERK